VGNPVTGALQALAESLPRAQAVTAIPDVQTMAMISAPDTAESCPPWNGPAEDVVTTAAAGIREVERELRTEITGHPGRVRGGSGGNTGASIGATAKLATQLPGHVHCPHTPRCARCCCLTCRTAAKVGAWVTSARLLPAIDEAARWVPIPGDPPCPYCATPSLRHAARAGSSVVACHNPGCADSDGQQPAATAGHSPRDGTPSLLWRDGLVTGG
jgi:hypothetical protein